MAFQFPWTNLHELNLDWFLSKFKQFTNNFLETTATAESVPNGTPPSVTVTGGELDDDTDIVDPFTFNFKIPAGAQGVQGEQGVPGQDGFSPIATVTKTGTVATITITDAQGTTSTTISDGEVTQAQLDTKAPVIVESANGSIASFSDGADNMPVNNLTIGINPVQSGSGDPAPDNIRPISGWTGANVTRAGKNLFDINKMVNTAQITVSNGVIYVSGNARNSNKKLSELADLIVGESYTLSANTTSIQYIIYLYGTGANITWNFGTTKTITQAMLNALVFFYGGSGTAEITNFMIRPATATDATFAPYITPTTYTLSWQNEAGTVYGGSLNVTTGVMTVTHGYIASYNGETLPGEWISDRDVYAPGTTPTNGAEVVYELATPQTYQLTPQQLFNTSYGGTSIWSNTGNTSITYPADTKLFIERLTQPTEDDMIANTAIANGKFFMIGNNLYRATTAIASGSRIIPGTNATPMSLADALNLL